ncbi:hypothetical protein CUMW_175460 [Citrus unshiu]|uniref:Uncharacterized protein n=1 Tax=Citrus unshiu TaxID=55188 RepID=A0A2H5PX00_CITUN|nr:hypothetical protein CUMW_175460 [Citrus unshiu]
MTLGSGGSSVVVLETSYLKSLLDSESTYNAYNCERKMNNSVTLEVGKTNEQQFHYVICLIAIAENSLVENLYGVSKMKNKAT